MPISFIFNLTFQTAKKLLFTGFNVNLEEKKDADTTD